MLTVDAYLYSENEATEAELEYENNAQLDPDIAVGDKVKITSSGMIIDNIPQIISGVTSIVKIAE